MAERETREPLQRYREKRDFSRTPEPAGEPAVSPERHVFVIQQHDASHLHYDLRLEVGGVLKSWAVPKGPSLDPHVRRLAMMTEDHPLEYAEFEGVIPEGNYGAGVVMVWDIGLYDNLSEKDGHPITMEQAFDKGHVIVRLHGHKLHGGFHLVRTAPDPQGRSRWLLIKRQDAAADPACDPTRDLPHSALTRRSLEQIARDEGRQHAA
jgi:DNA ligase D-like protein (predicted 3'-phosphoesterase)